METELRPPRSLVIAPTWVGDTVMALPAVEALAASGRRITVLAKPHLHSLLRLCPAVSGLLERRGSTAETIARLRQGRFDEAILLPNSFRAAWLAYRAGIPGRWGYRSDGRSLLLRPAVHRPAGERHQLRDYDQLLERMGVRPAVGPPALEVPDDVAGPATAAVDKELLECGAATGERPLIGLFPGAEFGPSKRWPAERFASTIGELAKRIPSAQPVLVAGPRERGLADSVRQAVTAPLPIIGPELDLAGLAAVLDRLDVLITNDSGPMHLAAAVGTPCVAIFGPTNPRRTSPGGGGHHVLFAGRWCSPCFRRRCPLIRHRCMTEIRVDHVVDATARALSAQRT